MKFIANLCRFSHVVLLHRSLLGSIVFLCACTEQSAPTAIDKNTLKVVTWNMEWFPSGSPQNVPVDTENQNIQKAAGLLKTLDADVVLLQEVKSWEVCERLVHAMKPIEYQVLVCSDFAGKQELAIISKYPPLTAWSDKWKSGGEADPPRGYAFAVIRFGDKDIGFYSLHLKSNLVMGNRPNEAQKNRKKRQISALQLVNQIKDIQTRLMPTVKSFVVGGDFNTNQDQPEFTGETTLTTLEEHGLKNAFGTMPLQQRITHPGSGRFPDATFDYLFIGGEISGSKPVITSTGLSDHYPVMTEMHVD